MLTRWIHINVLVSVIRIVLITSSRPFAGVAVPFA